MSLPVSLPDIAANNFCLASLFLAVCWYLPGMTWGWLLARPLGSPSCGGVSSTGIRINVRRWACSRALALWTDHLAATVKCLVFSLPAALLIAGLLACAHRFHPGWLLGVMLLFALAGLIFGGWRHAPVLWRHLRLSAPGGLLFIVVLSAILLPPRRGEWIAGGWDPGVYVNTGVAAARQGGFGDWPLAGWHELSVDEMDLFTRHYSPDYTEWFPGAPVDPAERSCRPYFFPITPLLIGTAFHAGGLRAATRANAMAGVMILPVFILMAYGIFRQWRYAALATLLLMLNPVFLYHLHTPVSEILELFVVCAVGWLMVRRLPAVGAGLLLAAVVMVGVLNRVSFIALASLFFLLVVCLDRARLDRRRLGLEHGVLLAAILLGVVIDLTMSGMIPRLRHVLPLLLGLSAAPLGLALILDGVWAWRPQFFSRRLLWAVPVALGLACLPVLWWLPSPLGSVTGIVGAAWETMRRLLPFWGWFLVGSAGMGLLAVVLDRRTVNVGSHAAMGWGLCLLAGYASLLACKWIADLYPWATRRFLSCGLPLLALLAAYALMWLRKRLPGSPVWARIVVLVWVAGLLGGQWPQRMAAWRSTEYDGLSSALAQVAAQIAPGDIVVADHFTWAMPLTMIYGRQVLNGAGLWQRPDPRRWDQFRALCERLGRHGRRIRFLTSTPRGLDLWGPQAPPGIQTWRGNPTRFETVIHSPRAAAFVVRQSYLEFRLYDWHPGSNDNDYTR